MRSGGNNFKVTKLANFVQFIRMLMICLDDREEGLSPLRPPPFGYATAC